MCGVGWYISLVAVSKITQVDLLGIGKYISTAASNADLASALFGLIVLVGVIFAIDRLVWKPLGNRAEKYKYETIASPRTTATRQSAVAAGVKRYEDRLGSPVLTFFKSETPYAASVLEITKWRRIRQLTPKLRFPERSLRIQSWRRVLTS